MRKKYSWTAGVLAVVVVTAGAGYSKVSADETDVSDSAIHEVSGGEGQTETAGDLTVDLDTDGDLTEADLNVLTQKLNILTDKITDLEQKRTENREQLENLKSEQQTLTDQEASQRQLLSDSIRKNYEWAPEPGSYESLFTSSVSTVSTISEGGHRSSSGGSEMPESGDSRSMLEAYQHTYEALSEKTAEVQNKRVAIRQEDSQIAALSAPADRIGAEITRRREAEAAAELSRKQEAAGTLSAKTVRQYLGTFVTTGYCPCEICCGEYGTGVTAGYTASGTKATAGRTVAMGGVPFGTKLEINGTVYTVEDRGTPYGHIDVYYNTHSEAQAHGLQHAEVYLITE